MKTSLRSLTLLYTVGLAFIVSSAVGLGMYAIARQSLQQAYQNRFEASARESAYQLVDPVYNLDAFAVQRLRNVLANSDPSLMRSLVIDRKGMPFGGWVDWQRDEVEVAFEEVQRTGSWRIDTRGVDTRDEAWGFFGPIVDASGEFHGAVVFEYSTVELRQDLNRMAGAAVATALAATLAGCLMGLALARRGTRPFRQLVESVREIGEQRFRTPVHISSFVELRQLAEAIDRMASQLDKTTVSLEEAEEARQEAERANKLKSRFLANLSHEVRTPLHAIVGHADLLRNEGVDATQADRLDGIQVAAGSLLQLIEDILDLALIESGNLEMNSDTLDLAQLVHEVVEKTHNRADPGTLDLFGLVAPTVERQRRGDAERIQQVLINLVSNALKFTRHGHVVLEVTAPASDRVFFVVHDTGPGIPASEIETIFQPFARLIADSASISGSGLGLAICRQLARAMHGELRIDSVEGEGTRATFEIPMPVLAQDRTPDSRPSIRPFGFPPIAERLLTSWFPNGPSETDEVALVYLEGCDNFDEVAATLEEIETVLVFSPSGLNLPSLDHVQTYRTPVTTVAIEEALEHREPTRQPTEQRSSFTDLEVLVVEDNLINQLVLSSMLEKLGCRVRTAADGQLGVEAWREHRPAILLMDCSMPVLDGFEATRMIRREEGQAGNNRVPILAVTAHTTKDDRQRAEQAGMDAFLTKPLAFDTLTELLTTWCGSPGESTLEVPSVADRG